jgi:hypothetical protein
VLEPQTQKSRTRLEYYDMPAVRKIVHDAASRDFRFSSLVLGAVESAPFQMRRKANEGTY